MLADHSRDEHNAASADLIDDHTASRLKLAAVRRQWTRYFCLRARVDQFGIRAPVSRHHMRPKTRALPPYRCARSSLTKIRFLAAAAVVVAARCRSHPRRRPRRRPRSLLPQRGVRTPPRSFSIMSNMSSKILVVASFIYRFIHWRAEAIKSMLQNFTSSCSSPNTHRYVKVLIHTINAAATRCTFTAARRSSQSSA